MVTLLNIFEIGSRAIFANQSAINTTAHNIANANTTGFSRQRVRLEPSMPLNLVPGQFGTGVNAVAVERIRDQFIDTQIRTQLTSNGFYASQQEVFGRLEVILNDPLNPISDNLTSVAQSGINAALTQLFDAWQELSLNPESEAIRANLREQALTTTEAFNVAARELQQLQKDVNDDIRNTLLDINSTARQIADLNRSISIAEVGKQQNANDLRDSRDVLVQKLARLLPIAVTEEENGTFSIVSLGVKLVENDQVKQFAAVERGGGTGLFDIVFDEVRSRSLTQDFNSGELGGLLHQRDTIIPGFQHQIDELASRLVETVNRIHSGAMGLEAFTSLTGARAVSVSTAPLGSGQLAFPVTAGAFSIRVYNGHGQEIETYRIQVDPNGTPGSPPPAVTLAELAQAIDAADGVTGGGSLTAVVDGGRLRINAGAGLKFSFNGDDTGVLGALGMNEFFTGQDASTISISDQIVESLARIAASLSGEVGDNTAALAIAQLRDQKTMDGNTVTFNDSYRATIASLGVQSRRISQLESTTAGLVNSLAERQDQVAGTSIDEESINLVRFQRAYTAAARIVTAVDELMDLVVNRLGLIGR